MRIEYSKTSNEPNRYFDMNGEEIKENDYVWMMDRKMKVYLTDQNCLGTDATNPKWIEIGRAVETEYGIYPFNEADEPYLIKETNNEDTSR